MAEEEIGPLQVEVASPDRKLKLRVFASMYEDWGLEITDRSGNRLFINHSCLSREDYGQTEGVPWTEAQWREAVETAAEELVDAYAPKAAWEYKKEFKINKKMKEVVEATIKATKSELAVLRRKLDKMQYGS